MSVESLLINWITSFMLCAAPSSDRGLNLLSDVIERIDKKGPVE